MKLLARTLMFRTYVFYWFLHQIKQKTKLNDGGFVIVIPILFITRKDNAFKLIMILYSLFKP